MRRKSRTAAIRPHAVHAGGDASAVVSQALVDVGACLPIPGKAPRAGGASICHAQGRVDNRRVVAVPEAGAPVAGEGRAGRKRREGRARRARHGGRGRRRPRGRRGWGGFGGGLGGRPPGADDPPNVAFTTLGSARAMFERASVIAASLKLLVTGTERMTLSVATAVVSADTVASLRAAPKVVAEPIDCSAEATDAEEDMVPRVTAHGDAGIHTTLRCQQWASSSRRNEKRLQGALCPHKTRRTTEHAV